MYNYIKGGTNFTMTIRTCINLCVNTRGFLSPIRPSSTLAKLLEDNGETGFVLKSMSTNIFENLAFEDWIHEHADLQNRTILFLWSNAPAVVIGRHQNPWQECNLPLMRERGIPLARRRSGGGTVFHDLGNINMTFFTCKKKYDRQRNLGIVINALKQLRPSLDVHATERFDILLNRHFKISGTAAKLGRTAAYHHCTLLCATDRSLLSGVLKSACRGIKSNATPSVPSAVKNLIDVDPTLDCGSVMKAVASQYQTDFKLNTSVILVDPLDDLSYPGIHKMTHELRTWEWVYGKTPKFSLDTCFEVPYETCSTNVMLTMDIKNGLIETCSIETPSDWLPPEALKAYSTLLVGSKFCPTEIAVLSAAVMRANPQNQEVETRMRILFEEIVAVM